MKTLAWNPECTDTPIRTALETLAQRYPLKTRGKAGLRVEFNAVSEAGVCRVKRDGKSATIEYGSPAQATRGVGALLAGLVRDGKTYEESTPFKSLGIMLDCSRNAVMTVAHVKRWMQQLSLLGYNMVMLYTEDTYELPDEPYFGYQRGAYTEAELREIDAYAALLNIEVVPCIQTLGHLAQILKHGAYRPVKDTASVMLVDAPETYELIEKMISHWRSVCRTDRIHVGMDETHDLGRGRFMDLNGYEHGFELFNRHLGRVVEICKKHDFAPIIWSDMYFRLGCASGGYYDPATNIPQDVVEKIPADAQLVYWDYYHSDKAFYLDWIQRHRDLGKEPLMGSGIWTWNKYWYDHRLTVANAGPCVDACVEAGVAEVFFTQWGDNGAYCDHDAAFAGMAYCADKSYGKDPDDKALEKRFAAVCGGSYENHILAADIHGGVPGFQPNMWDDPIFETHVRTFAKDDVSGISDVAKAYERLARQLKSASKDHTTGDLRYAWRTAAAFAKRYALLADLLAAYRSGKKKRLAKSTDEIAKVRRAIRAMADAFRAMWMNHNKPQGIEHIQARFGMLDARYAELTQRLAELADGSIDSIPEWDCQCPPGNA